MAFYREPYDYKKFPLSLFLKNLKKALLAGEEKKAIYLALRLYEFSYTRGYEVINTKKGRSWSGVVIKEKLLSFLRKFTLSYINIGGLGALPYVEKHLQFLQKNSPLDFLERVKSLISLVRFLTIQYKFPLSYWKYKYKKKEKKEKFLLILTTFTEHEFGYRFKALSYLGEFAWPLLRENIEEEFMETLYSRKEEEYSLLVACLALLLPSRANFSCEFLEREFKREEVCKCIEDVFKEEEINQTFQGIKKVWSFEAP